MDKINLSMLQHKMPTVILPPHRNTTVHFDRCYFYCTRKLHRIYWQGTANIFFNI